jgi:hypothetical protein
MRPPDRAPSGQDELDAATFAGFCLGLAAAGILALVLSGIPSAALAALAVFLSGGR